MTPLPSPKQAEIQVKMAKRKLDECLDAYKWFFSAAYDRKITDEPKVRTSRGLSAVEQAGAGESYRRRRERAARAWEKITRMPDTLDRVLGKLERSMPDHRPAETELEPVPDIEGPFIAERRAIQRQHHARGEGYGAD